MGTISIWHWIIVLIFFGVPVIAIATASADKTLSRMPYLGRTAGLIAAGLGLSLLTGVAADGDSVAMIVVFAVGGLVLLVAISVLGALWSVHRIQDIGVSKWWCLLLLVPVANLICILYLIFYPGQEVGDRPVQPR